MRFLVPSALATLIAAVAMSAAASVPVTGAAATVPTRTSLPFSTSLPTTTSSPATAARPMTRAGAGVPATPPGTSQVAPLGAPRGSFSWPLSPRPVVRRRFEQPWDQWAPGHRGVDLVAAVGQPVSSAGDGIVAFSGMVAGRGVITVAHPDGLRTSYVPVDQRLTSGTLVHRGTPIGVISTTPGHCAPVTCLHWGVIAGAAYRDPLSLLGFGRPILLPLG